MPVALQGGGSVAPLGLLDATGRSVLQIDSGVTVADMAYGSDGVCSAPG